MANISTDKALFTMTPAPSEQNQSKEIWNGYLNDGIDEINVVNMRTNELVGTIGGGGGEYKFDNLPTSYYPKTPYDSKAIGDYIENYTYADKNNSYFIDEGEIYILNYSYINHFSNGIMMFGGFNVTQTNTFLFAFKINEDDKSLLDFVAKIEIPNTSNLELYGYLYTYRPIGVDNECYYIYNSYPTSDSILLETYQTKVTITESNGIYSLSLENINYNYGAKTVLELYNENAPSPVSGVDWIYRSPIFGRNDEFYAILNGRDEGWVWYGNVTSGEQTLFPYLAGFNIVTGETAYIEPIASLSATTNFNPVGTIDYTYFSINWESHPAGVYFQVYNQQVLDNLNNTNSVTALYSPRWVNNDKVTFLEDRSPTSGQFNNYNGIINAAYGIGYIWDSENIYIIGNYGPIYPSQNSPLRYVSKYKLDSNESYFDLEIIPKSNIDLSSEFLAFNDFVLISSKYDNGYGQAYTRYSYAIWKKDESTLKLIKSNTSYTIMSIINNKVFSPVYNIVGSFMLQYDEYKKITF